MVNEPNEFILRINNISNIDYGHFLAFHDGKCKRVHHHSGAVSAEVGGILNGPWVVDFGDIKRIIKDVIDQIDHKFVVCNKYTELRQDRVIVKYNTSAGSHYMELPFSEIFVFDQEPTLENIVYYIARKVLDQLPENVTYVKIIAQEGMGGSAEIMVRRK